MKINKVDVSKEEGSRVALEIEVPEEVVRQESEKIYSQLEKQATVPGFRKGKVPRGILETRYEKEVRGELIECLVSQAYQEAISQTNLVPLGQAEVKELKLEKNKPFSFKAFAEVKPEVKLGQYKGLRLEKERVEKVKEKDVHARLEEIRERQALFVPLKKESVEKGDFLSIDFKGLVKGIPFAGGSGENYTLEAGSDSFFGLGSELLGIKVNETKEIKITLPREYPHQELAGQEATFKVTLKEIKEKRLPPLDDEFAKDLGEFSTLEELRSRTREDLNRSQERLSQEKLNNYLMDKLIQGNELEVPSALIEREIEHLIVDLKENLRREGLTYNRYLNIIKTDEAGLKERYKPLALRRVKSALILEAIAQEEKITVTEEELEERIKELALFSKEEPSKLRERLEKNNLLPGLKAQIKEKKTVEFLLKESRIKPVKKKGA
jgi:trigger factor